MRSIVIGFGLLVLSLLVLFKISKVNFIQENVRLEVIVAIMQFFIMFVTVFIIGFIVTIISTLALRRKPAVAIAWSRRIPSHLRSQGNKIE